MEGDDGYSTINSRLRSLPTGRSLPYEVIDENTMLSLWDNCPITYTPKRTVGEQSAYSSFH